MAKLIGKPVNSQIVEFYGPINGRNYNTSGGTAIPPEINVQVFGTGEVQVQQTQTFIMKGNAGNNVFTRDKLPDATTWTNLGGTIDQASGLTTVAPTVDNSFSAIRVIVTTEGEGNVVVESHWS